MDIVIPTLGRCDMIRQPTLKQLNNAEIYPIMVVQPHEADWWMFVGPPTCQVRILPAHVKGIAATRDYIMYDMPTTERYVTMLDDDLHFAVRRDDDRTKFRQPESKDIKEMLHAIEAALQTHPHVSIGAREGGNRVTEAVVMNTRMMRVLAYDRYTLCKHHVAFTPMEVMEDFHVTLQLLRMGYNCAVLNNWVSNQSGGSDAAGGCSTFRTLEVQGRNAERLAALHPGLVKTVRKQTKTAWGGQARTDVIVQWKRAHAAGENS